jgi:hypothetical protein
MTIIAVDYKAMNRALTNQGFFLVADLPRRISIQTRRGMLVARIS